MTLQNLLKNWKTTLAGIMTIAGVITSTWLPQYADELSKATAVLMGLGLLAAKDGNKTGA